MEAGGQVRIGESLVILLTYPNGDLAKKEEVVQIEGKNQEHTKNKNSWNTKFKQKKHAGNGAIPYIKYVQTNPAKKWRDLFFWLFS
jgi:hypothetical protein